MRPSLIDRHRRRIAAIAASDLDVATLPDALLEAFHDAIGFDAICAGTFDPVTLLPTSLRHVGIAAVTTGRVSLREALAVTLSREQRRRYHALARTTRPAEIFSRGQGRQPEHSVVWRRLCPPAGSGHSLLALLVADTACYGFINFLRASSRPDFTTEQLDLAVAIGPDLARAVRAAVRQRGRGPVPARPGVIVFDETLAITSTSTEARHWLADLEHDHKLVCPVVHALAATALDAGGELTAPGSAARVCSRSGVWLQVSATSLDGAPGGADQKSVAVVIEPASAEALAPVMARAYGLTVREQEVAVLAGGGHTSAGIARALGISPHTVNDHLENAFRKVGVRRRQDLALALGCA